MAELTFKSAGVSTREIDLSQPTIVGPQGVPAGIIGTALEGPAFVPITVANFSEFVSVFGNTDGKKFGPLAVNEWLKNAKACTYIRVLGIGDGKKRNTTTGVVTNAGFFVGNQQVQANGTVGNSVYANHSAGGTVKGRTYFLGCFMSESNGSTIFSDAGIQNTTRTAATAIDCIDTDGYVSSNADASFTIAISTAAGGLGGTAVTIFLDENENGAHTSNGTNKISIGTFDGSETDALAASYIIDAINGVPTATNARLVYASSGNGEASDNLGITAAQGTSSTKITLTMDRTGTSGNITSALAHASGFNMTDVTAFTGGVDDNHAVPILRGVVLAPSGVILHLSGTNSKDTSKPADDALASKQGGHYIGLKGGLTGSLKIASQEFVILMNGYKGSVENKTHITASFDVTAPNYISKVLNSDPSKIEEKGHLLYSHYDIYPTLAKVTGSGAGCSGQDARWKKDSVTDNTKVMSAYEDIAFLLTGSNSRGKSSSLGNIPDYEDFKDRFTHAASPYLISQKNVDLFKLVALAPGQDISTQFKFSIENLRTSNSDVDKYGSFDLVIRSFNDSDTSKSVLESFRGLSLDTSSPRYIARVIGDQNMFFDFDNDSESQKIIVDGSHPVRSKYVRVKISDDVKRKNVDDAALPVGFRGPMHLVTSGTMLSKETGDGYDNVSIFTTTEIHQRTIEPPIPYRNNLTIGTGLNKKVDNRFCWGIQTDRQVDPADPNKLSGFDTSFNSFAKYFPTHRKDTTAFSVGDNPSAADINGSVLSCDNFNNNKFSLLNLKIRTGSDTVADTNQWISASYVRNGVIATDHATKTRAFKVSDLNTVGNRKYAKFSCFLQGGSNGVNIFNKDKFELSNNAAKREIDDASLQGGVSGPTVAAYRKAIDVMGSKTDVDIQLLSIPGMRHSSVTDYAISAVENRFDSLLIMDIEERDQFNSIVTSSVQNVHVNNTITELKNRALDSSFASAYFPDVTMTDPTTRGFVQVPPSVAVLGAFALNDRIGHPWFAPAGFTRGALDAVELSSVKFNRSNLDALYDADINPITSFPGTGITIWGQKTLLQSQSALDRINVRRLLINVRRKVRNIANTLLFEPNRVETLEKFTALVDPILQRIQSLSGVDRYKVVIDTSTTTQADVENNTIRGKIFLQPTRTAEFVALDFVVTNAGSELL